MQMHMPKINGWCSRVSQVLPVLRQSSSACDGAGAVGDSRDRSSSSRSAPLHGPNFPPWWTSDSFLDEDVNGDDLDQSIEG